MTHDLLLTGALLIDGSGSAPRRADVAVRDGRIAAVGAAGTIATSTAREAIDLDGFALSPGFIDAHTHDDRALLAAPAMAPKLSQGVTTVIVGNCGISLAPLGQHEPVPPLNLVVDAGEPRFDTFADYFAALEREPPAINCAALIGHTTLRAATMDRLDRAATPAEIAAMREKVAEGLAAGALGVSTGTYYAPAFAATPEEILGVCEPLRGTTTLIASHIRDEGVRVLESMTEAMNVSGALGVRQVISHHKVFGKPNFGRSRETLALFDQARLRADVCLDCYPYSASSTVLRIDSVALSRRTLIAWSKTRPEAAGRYVDELLAESGLTVGALVDALQPAGAIYYGMDDADVERILAYPETMIGSDGLPHDAFPHPRLWGAFPRVLGHYVRDRSLFTLETAVHKMTGLPAARFRLAGRGTIAPGCHADLVVFDPARIADAATFTHPTAPAAGIRSVYVNGVLAWQEGAGSGLRSGQIIRRAQ